MARDNARVWTDSTLAEIEAHLTEIYRTSRDQIAEKWDAYMQKGQAKLNKLYQEYLSAPEDAQPAAFRKYQQALDSYTLKNQWYQDMVNETTLRLAKVNDIAVSYVNGKIPAIYTVNYNQLDPNALNLGIKWTIRDEYTVRNLMADTLPNKQINYAKDMTWNMKQINNGVLQGILQGESIDKISKRLFPVIMQGQPMDSGIIHKNEIAARRTARTMVTGAENRGRLDRYSDYESEGVIMTKVWIATPDNRVRDWHISMDGQEVGVNEPFTDGLGYHLMYPGDGSAPPETVYNCRCTMRSHITGIRQSDGTIKRITYSGDTPTMHAGQIAAEKARRKVAKKRKK